MVIFVASIKKIVRSSFNHSSSTEDFLKLLSANGVYLCKIEEEHSEKIRSEGIEFTTRLEIFKEDFNHCFELKTLYESGETPEFKAKNSKIEKKRKDRIISRLYGIFFEERA